MNAATRKTRACTIDALDEELKAVIRAHGTKFGLEDIESDVLMCCETITVHQKKGFLGGIKIKLSMSLQNGWCGQIVLDEMKLPRVRLN